MLHLLLHLACFANFGWTVYWDTILMELPSQKTFGGQWKYLTFINCVIQLVYFTISIVNDVVGTHSKTTDSSSSIQKARDYVFATLAFPIGQFVGFIFWTLWFIDRELVLPKAFDIWFPTYINHMMHTTVIPAQLLELILIYHIYPGRIKGMATSMGFCLAYLCWIMVIAYVGGIWVYPILKILDPVPRAAFVITCSLIGGVLYIVGEKLNTMVWGNQFKTDETTSKKQSRGRKPQKVD